MPEETDGFEPPKYAVSRAVGDIEAFCGVVVAGLLSLMILLGAVYVVIAPWLDPSSNRLTFSHPWIIYTCGSAVLIAEVLSFALMIRAMQRSKQKRLLALAEAHPRFPVLFRPLVFLWWTAHACLIAIAGHYITLRIRIVEDPDAYQRGVTDLIRAMFAVGISFSTNSYLMLMAASLTRRRGVLLWVFRLRLIADVALIIDLLLPGRWI